MPTYAASGIIYAKATPSNLAVALTPSGGTDEQITDRINPPTLATGKITADTASDVVTGVDVDFTTDCEVGEYLFAYGAGAVPVLVGKIASIDSGGQQLTLTANASSDADEAPYGVMKTLLKTNENILIRVPRIPLNNNQSYIPDWASMRVRPFGVNDFNDPSITEITQYSSSGVPVDIGGGTNIPFLIEPYNRFTVYTNNNVSFCWRDVREFPNFIFALYNPYGNNSQSNLNAATMYQIFTVSQIPGLLISTNYLTNGLKNAGYFISENLGQVGTVNTNPPTNTGGNN